MLTKSLDPGLNMRFGMYKIYYSSFRLDTDTTTTKPVIPNKLGRLEMKPNRKA
jgi:hypothetical protein